MCQCIYMEMKIIRWPTSGRLETKMSGVYDWEVRWCCWLLLVRLLLLIPVQCWNQSHHRSYITCCLHSPPQSPLQLQTPKLRSVPSFRQQTSHCQTCTLQTFIIWSSDWILYSLLITCFRFNALCLFLVDCNIHPLSDIKEKEWRRNY